MINFTDKAIKIFCAPVISIDYLVGRGISKTILTSEKDYVDLRLLFAANESQLKEKLTPLMKLSTDKNGVAYARLTIDGVKYAENNDFSFISAWKRIKTIKKVPLYNAKNMMAQNLEREIVDDCDNSLQADYNQTKKFYSTLIDTLSTSGLKTTDVMLNQVKQEKTPAFKMSSNGIDYTFFKN